MTFNDLNLNTPLLNALSDLGYTEPTPIQEMAFSPIMSGRDVIGIAQTGTGKTLAYILPILRQLKYSEQTHIRVLVVVPTRELVLQIAEDFEKLTGSMSVRIGGIYGGVNINPQKQMVMDGLDVLIATPGRLIDICMSGAMRLKSVQKLVIDEVDEMLNLGFRPQLTTLLDMLPQKRQNLLFSATLTEGVEDLIETFFNNPIKVEVVPTGTPLEKIVQGVFRVPNYYTKLNLLKLLLQSGPNFTKVLVFVESKKIADRLFSQLEGDFPGEIGIIHSNKTQNYRLRSVQNFQEGLTRILIATDIIARGLDLSGVSHVINFDVPETPENYMHRIGRTGRKDSEGVALSFVTEREEPYLKEAETLMKMQVQEEPLPENLEISQELTPEEEPELPKQPFQEIARPTGGFHEKKDKNKKVNMGGSYKRTIKQKYKKPQKRGTKKK